MEKQDILNKWTEYKEEVFDDNRASKPIIKKNIQGPSIMKDEVRQAIKSMKKKQSNRSGRNIRRNDSMSR